MARPERLGAGGAMVAMLSSTRRLRRATAMGSRGVLPSKPRRFMYARPQTAAPTSRSSTSAS